VRIYVFGPKSSGTGTCPYMAIRILIADEHDLMREALRSLIESHEGWEVCGEAEDGVEAVPEATLVSDIRGNRARTKS